MNVKYKKDDIKNIYFSSLSIAGLIILAILVFYTPSSKIIYPHQNLLILSIFVFICILGMMAALSPVKCSELSSFKKNSYSNPKQNFDEDLPSNNFKGHHPDCNNFKTHTYSFRGKKYCAGCSGLFLGALIAIVGTSIYYLYGINDENTGRIIFLIGFLTVLVSLLQNFLLKLNINLSRFFFNFILVIGSVLIMIGISELQSSLFIQSYFLVLVFIWILARITSSERNHYKICNECSMESCIYQ